MARSISVYIGGDYYHFLPNASIRSGGIIMGPLMSLNIESNIEALGGMILKAFEYAPDGIVEYNKNTMGIKQFYPLMQIKSWNNFFNKFKSVSVSMTDEAIIFLPTYRDEKYKAYMGTPDKPEEYAINKMSNAEIGKALLDCFSKCR